MIISPHPIVLYDPDTWSAQSDCDCACPSAPPVPHPPLDRPLRLRSHPLLRHIPLNTEYSVAFVPSFSRVAVLNRAARTMLALPVELNNDQRDDQRDGMITLCYRLGLLTENDGALPLPPRPDTLSAWLHVTNACNLRCTYCYVAKSDEAMTEEIGLAAIDAVFRSALANDYRAVWLKYGGGEASLNLALVDRMQRHALGLGTRLGIAVHGKVLSNGTVLTTRRLQHIRDLGLGLMVSLDGMEAIHDQQRPTIAGRGSFRLALASLERALALGLCPDVSITVTGASVAGLPDLLRWILPRDLPFSINFVRPLERGVSRQELQLDERRIIDGMRAAFAVIAENLPRRSLLGALLDRAHLGAAHERTCAAGQNYLVIDHQGRIATCQMELAHPVADLSTPDPLALIRADRSGVQNLPVDQKEGCRTCEWRYWCAGGCAVATYRATGRYDVRSPNCGIYTALYGDVLRLEGLRLLQQSTGRIRREE